MSKKLHCSFDQFDFILDKPSKKLELLEEKSDDGGSDLPITVDAFLSSIVDAYGMVGEMTSANKQQVSSKLAAVKEKSVQCNHEMIGGSFDGVKWKAICRSIMDTLIQTVQETRQAQMLRQIQLCDQNLSRILKLQFIEIIVTEYERLLINAARLLQYVYKYISWGMIRGHQTQNTLLLCASQLQKLFPLLLHALEVSDSGHCCPELKEYIVERMKVCLLKINSVINGSTSVEDKECDDLGGGLFMTHMDQALSYLAVFDSLNGPTVLCDQWRESVEAVLHHAMSIAQITSEFDFKGIHASGEKILRECDHLDREYKSANRNPSVCKLHALSLSNALEELEQRVCASVLKMYLQVFSSPFSPLQDLCLKCLSTKATENERSSEDIADAVFTFDTHTDRILQVALFAIACSEDQNRVLGIRSCLASLESLEVYLVPALTTLYLNQTTKQHILAKVLVEHWNSEVKLLWQQIDGIVDPAALAQVTHNEIFILTAGLKKAILANRKPDKNHLLNTVRSIVSNADVLSHQLEGSEPDLNLAPMSPFYEALRELLQAVKEGKAVTLKMESADSALSSDRILKRCELLVSCVGKIQHLLEELDNPEPTDISPQAQENFLHLSTKAEGKKDRDSSMSLKNLKKHLISLGLPSDAEIEIDTTDVTGVQDAMLSLIDKTAAQPRFMTSFLYNESKRATTNQSMSCTPKYFPCNNTFSRKEVQPEPKKLLQKIFSLDVSKLTSLSETLRQNSSSVDPLVLKKQEVMDSEVGENSSKDISTPERMRDLLCVQNKIEAVKISSQSFYNRSIVNDLM